jgi:hypothetical protein
MTVTLEDIKAWAAERFADVREAGSLSVVVLLHYNAAGQEVELHSVTAKAGAERWNADAVATIADQLATRHARGLTGVQQFQLVAAYGQGGKPVAPLPFQRAGGLTHGPLPGGGLATEAPTPSGITQLSMRWGELAIQQAGAKDQAITTMMGTLLQASWARNGAVEKQLDDTRENFMKLAIEYHKVAQQSALRSLLIRGAEKVIPLLPAAAGALTGARVDQHVAENSFFDSMVESYTPEQLKAYVDSMKQPAKATAAKMLVDAQRRKEARESESRRAALADPEAEVLDDAYRSIAGEPRNANGKAEAPPKVEVPNASKTSSGTASEGDKIAVLDALLGQVSTEQLALLEPVLGAELTAKVRAIKEQQEARP